MSGLGEELTSRGSVRWLKSEYRKGGISPRLVVKQKVPSIYNPAAQCNSAAGRVLHSVMAPGQMHKWAQCTIGNATL